MKRPVETSLQNKYLTSQLLTPIVTPMSNTGKIASEIKQSVAFSSIQQEAMLTLMRTTDRLKTQIGQCIAESTDLTYQQYNVLRILRGAGKDGLPTLQIAERMVEGTPGITRLIDRLIKKGLVERIRCPHDRRQVLCSITEAGLQCIKPLDKKLEQLNLTMLGHVSEPKLKQLITILDHIRSP